jgi:nucleotide-binding universal stress UspA family protein
MPEPIVSAATGVQPDGGEFRILVPLANPKHETDLITLAGAIANQRDGVVEAIHIITVPDQTSLEYASRHFENEREASQELLEAAERDAGYYGVPFEKSTIFSHRSIDEVFDAAREHDADMVVMGWGAHTAGRAESAFDELTHSLPCDFLVFKDRGFEPDEILLPTAGGPSSELSADIAAVLADEFGSEITVLHVADDIEAGRAFLEEWSAAHGLAAANQVVESGDVDTVIENAAGEATMVILGATERGLISRLLTGSVVVDIVNDVECSVLITEPAHKRSLRQRLFGR